MDWYGPRSRHVRRSHRTFAASRSRAGHNWRRLSAAAYRHRYGAYRAPNTYAGIANEVFRARDAYMPRAEYTQRAAVRARVRAWLADRRMRVDRVLDRMGLWRYRDELMDQFEDMWRDEYPNIPVPRVRDNTNEPIVPDYVFSSQAPFQ